MTPRYSVLAVALTVFVIALVQQHDLNAVRDRLHRLEQRPAVVQHTVVTHDVSAPRASRSAPRVVRPLIGPRRAATPETSLDWAALAQCESSGNPRALSPSGRYRGAFQMDADFWRTYGGLRFASRPDLATYTEQLTVAQRGYAARGRAPWPVCGRRL